VRRCALALAAIFLGMCPAFAADGFSHTNGIRRGQMLLLVVSRADPLSDSELSNLIGHSVHDSQGGYVGSVAAVHLGRDKKVKAVIIGLSNAGSESREVALSWQELRFSSAADKITVMLPTQALHALPRYTYLSADLRGTVFGDID